jgi:hypothetical protein
MHKINFLHYCSLLKLTALRHVAYSPSTNSYIFTTQYQLQKKHLTSGQVAVT